MKRMKRIFSLLLSVAIVLSMTACKGEKKSVVTDNLPEFSVNGKTDLPGNFYLSFVYSRNIIMLDGEGNIVWSKHEEQPKEGMQTGWWDFKKHEVDGKTYYSYHDQTGTYDNYGLEGFAPGERVILDENFNEIKRITFEESDTVSKGHPLDGHDFLMIDLDHYILSGYIKETVDNVPDYPDGSSVVYSYLQEVDNGEVIWDWKSSDYPELYSMTVTDASETANDYANEKTDVPDCIHFNSMRLDENGDLICSFRHINSILSLDRSKDKDQIKWKLSGSGDEFGLSEDQKSSCQHYATIDDDYITIFDNGNKNKKTRICSYKLDTEKMSLSDFCSYEIDGKFSEACGDAQKLHDETYMIGWGAATKDTKCMSVYDFAADEELFSVALKNPKNFTYRCVYYE
ncbi:MAG: aryl-sulfate sulfotransferase [Lachnospiraceae bacterium]|nr:aryl-sulfate sulfotransferase [Lachnospiraceae bacterium]